LASKGIPGAGSVDDLIAYLCPMQEAQFDLQARWWNLEARLVERFGKKPDMETILFLIGVQELGNIRRRFSKEEKQDLMHIAVCSLFRQSGYYEMEGTDKDGWPHFRQLKALPVMDMREQENFLKDHILLYFETAEAISPGLGIQHDGGREEGEEGYRRAAGDEDEEDHNDDHGHDHDEEYEHDDDHGEGHDHNDDHDHGHDDHGHEDHDHD
jgi:hypothetical protein